MKQFRYLFVALSILAFVGCSSKGGEKPEDGSDPTASNSTIDGDASARGTDDSGVNGEGLSGTNGRNGSVNMPTENVVYFDFDKSDVRDGQDRNVVEGHAAYLAANRNSGARLEGHADERGSREYNLALGERRANGVKQMLGILGVSNEQISVLSYGEEQPAATGHDETSWQLNRRVEIVHP